MIFVLNRKGASPLSPTNIICFLYVSFDAGRQRTAAIIIKVPLYDIIIEQYSVIIYCFLILYNGLRLNLFDYCFTPRKKQFWGLQKKKKNIIQILFVLYGHSFYRIRPVSAVACVVWFTIGQTLFVCR